MTIRLLEERVKGNSMITHTSVIQGATDEPLSAMKEERILAGYQSILCH